MDFSLFQVSSLLRTYFCYDFIPDGSPGWIALISQPGTRKMKKSAARFQLSRGEVVGGPRRQGAGRAPFTGGGKCQQPSPAGAEASLSSWPAGPLGSAESEQDVCELQKRPLKSA